MNAPATNPWSTARQATITMVYGEIGAGKTTYARRLEHDGAIRLSLDAWTIAATGDVRHVTGEVIERILDQLFVLWPPIAAAGVDVVLDFGFWDRARRDQVRALAHELGADVVLVRVICDIDQRRHRCLGRSDDQRDTYAIDHAAFEWISENRRIDPLGTDEPHVVVDTTTE